MKVESAENYETNHSFRGFNASFPSGLFNSSNATAVGLSVVVYAVQSAACARVLEDSDMGFFRAER